MRKNGLRKIISIFTIFILVLSISLPVAATKIPNIEIVSDIIPEGKAGQTLTVPVTLKNNSNYLAMQTTVKPILDDDTPFIIDELYTKKSVDTLSPGKVTDPIEFKFTIDRNAKKGTYKINFQINYTNTDQQNFTQTEIVYVKVTSEHLPVELIIDNVNYNKEKPVAGEEFNMTIDVKNTGTLLAENVIVSLQSNDKFAITNNASEQYLLNVPGMSSKSVSYKMTANKNLESGSYPINCTLKYTNNFDESETKELTIYIPVLGSSQSSNTQVVIENINSPDQVQAGDDFNISFDVTNKGQYKASNVTVILSSEDENIVPITLNKQLIGDLQAGKRMNLSYSFRALDELKTKNYPIKIDISYTQGEGENKVTSNQQQYVGVLVNENESADSGTVPLMIIEKYEPTPNIVKAGENFTLDLVLWNTSSKKSVENMKVTLKVTESGEKTTNDVFTPVDGSNTLYIPYLAPNERTQKQLTMFTVPDASAKTYKIEAIFEYEYNQNGEVAKGTASDIIGIPVVQPAKLDVADIQAPFGAMVGDSTELEIQFYNTGKVALTNLMVKIEGNFMVQNGTYFVGNFESGQQDWFYPEIYPQEPGENSGKVIFTYEDPTGKEQVLEREFSFIAEEAFNEQENMVITPGFDEINIQEPEQESKLPIIIGISVGVVLLVVIIIMIRRRKKKGMSFDEDL